MAGRDKLLRDGSEGAGDIPATEGDDPWQADPFGHRPDGSLLCTARAGRAPMSGRDCHVLLRACGPAPLARCTTVSHTPDLKTNAQLNEKA